MIREAHGGQEIRRESVELDPNLALVLEVDAAALVSLQTSIVSILTCTCTLEIRLSSLNKSEQNSEFTLRSDAIFERSFLEHCLQNN